MIRVVWVTLMATVVLNEVRAFFQENRGIELYVRYPWLIALILLIAVPVGIALAFLVERHD